MGRLVRWVLTLLVVVAGGWTVWWFSAAAGQQAALEGWLEDRSDAGWLAEAKSIEVNGFPEAFRMRVDEIALADPAHGLVMGSARAQGREPDLHTHQGRCHLARGTVHRCARRTGGAGDDAV